MSKIGRQNQGGSGKPNFTSYKNGRSAKKDKKAKTKHIAAGKERAREQARQAALAAR